MPMKHPMSLSDKIRSVMNVVTLLGTILLVYGVFFDMRYTLTSHEQSIREFEEALEKVVTKTDLTLATPYVLEGGDLRIKNLEEAYKDWTKEMRELNKRLSRMEGRLERLNTNN